MRLSLAALALATLPTLGFAQTAPATPRRDAPITRDQYVQTASQRAGARFDAIDTAHTGTITRAQIKAYRDSQGRPAQ